MHLGHGVSFHQIIKLHPKSAGNCLSERTLKCSLTRTREIVHIGNATLRANLREFLEGKARNLGDDEIHAPLEARGGFAREFVEPVADGEFGGRSAAGKRR